MNQPGDWQELFLEALVAQREHRSLRAKAASKLALEAARVLPHGTRRMAVVHACEGLLSHTRKRYQRAETLLDIAMQLGFSTEGDLRVIHAFFVLVAEVKSARVKHTQAMHYYERAASLALN